MLRVLQQHHSCASWLTAWLDLERVRALEPKRLLRKLFD